MSIHGLKELSDEWGIEPPPISVKESLKTIHTQIKAFGLKHVGWGLYRGYDGSKWKVKNGQLVKLGNVNKYPPRQLKSDLQHLVKVYDQVKDEFEGITKKFNKYSHEFGNQVLKRAQTLYYHEVLSHWVEAYYSAVKSVVADQGIETPDASYEAAHSIIARIEADAGKYPSEIDENAALYFLSMMKDYVSSYEDSEE